MSDFYHVDNLATNDLQYNKLTTHRLHISLIANTIAVLLLDQRKEFLVLFEIVYYTKL